MPYKWAFNSDDEVNENIEYVEGRYRFIVNSVEFKINKNQVNYCFTKLTLLLDDGKNVSSSDNFNDDKFGYFKRKKFCESLGDVSLVKEDPQSWVGRKGTADFKVVEFDSNSGEKIKKLTPFNYICEPEDDDLPF